MSYKDFNAALPHIVSIDNMNDIKPMKNEFKEMNIYYNCQISSNHNVGFDYMDIIDKANKLSYIYRHSSLTGGFNLNETERAKIFTKLKGSVVTKESANKISEDIRDSFFLKFKAESYYSNNDNISSETFILHPVSITNEHGSGFINHSITIYKNGLIDYNMHAPNDMFTLYKDWTIGVRLTELKLYDYKKEKYTIKHYDISLEELGRRCLQSFVENILSIKIQKSIDAQNINYTEYKIFQCNYIVTDKKMKEKLIKLGSSPLQEDSNIFNIESYEIKNFKSLSFFSNNYSSIIFTEKNSKVIEQSKNDTSVFNGLYSEFSVSIWPLLVERHVDKKIIDYYSKEEKFHKNDYLLFREKIKSLSVLKSKFLDSNHQTILTLMSILSDDINPSKEKALVKSYLEDISDYIQMSLTNNERNSDKNTQKLLLLLALLTSYSVLLELPLPNPLVWIIGIALTLIVILLIRE